MNPVERAVRGFDRWQQRHPVAGFPVAVVKKFGDDQAGNLVGLLAYYGFVAAFPLLLALTSIIGAVLQSRPKLQHHLLDSAFAEFPIIGGQIHQQLGVSNFGSTFSLIIGIIGSSYGARGFANSLQNTLNTVWAVPKVDRPDLLHRYLRMIATLLMLGLIVIVTGASGAAGVTAASWGFGGISSQTVSFVVGSVLGTAFFLALFRIAASGKVAIRSMVLGAAISAIGWQLLLITAGVIVTHQLRHAQAVAGFFGVVLGLLAWLTLQATVIVYAMEIDVVRANRWWPRSILQPPLTKADKAFYNSALHSETRRPEQQLDIDYESEEQNEPHEASG